MYRYILLISLFLAFLPSVEAADYYDVESSLFFSYADNYTATDYTSEYNKSQSASLRADKYLLIGPGSATESSGLFEIIISGIDLNTMLEQLQLRVINADTISNRDLLSFTGIEVVGRAYTQNAQRRALILGLPQKTLLVIYKGSDVTEYDGFLNGIKLLVGFLDTQSNPLNIEIADVAEREIFQGYVNPPTNSREFRPEQGINRAEFLKVLVLAAPGVNQSIIDSFYSEYREGLERDTLQAIRDNDKETKPLFEDVDRGAWFAPYIFYAYEQGWIQGYPDGSFRPVNLVNIAEASKIILGSRTVTLAQDEQVWFRPFMDYFDSKNVIAKKLDKFLFPFTDRQFYPYENCTRAQAAAFLSRLLWLEENDETQYFREISMDQVNFSFTFNLNFKIYEYGRNITDDTGVNSYKISLSDQRTVYVYVFTPDVWTGREIKSEQNSFLADLHYIGEDKTYIYATRLECTGPQACEPDAIKNQFLGSFEIVSQDLSSFSDPNLAFTFLYSQSLSFETDVQENSSNVFAVLPDGTDAFVINYLIGNSYELDNLEGQTPISEKLFGNSDWKIYRQSDNGKNILNFVKVIGYSDLLVVSVSGIQNVSELDPKIIRVLRSSK